MGKPILGLTLKQVWPRVPYLDHYYLSENLSTTTKLFAVDTSLFSIEPLHNTYVNHLNSDFRKISHLAVQWKMSFNPDPRKQAKEVIFSGKNLLFQ